MVCASASISLPRPWFYVYILTKHTHIQNFNLSFCTSVNGPHLHLYNIPFQLPQHRELCGLEWCICALLTAPTVGLILKHLPETSSQLSFIPTGHSFISSLPLSLCLFLPSSSPVILLSFFCCYSLGHCLCLSPFLPLDFSSALQLLPQIVI